MERFLDWFEEHKLSVIGTLALHSMLLFLFTMLELRDQPAQEMMNLSHVDVMEPEKAEELMERIEHPELVAAREVINATSNITADRVTNQFSHAHLAERVENDLKAMEQAEFDRLAQERRDQGKEIVIPELDPSKWNKEQYMKTAAEPVRVEGATTVWHDLKGRTRENDVPGYLCKEMGRVAVAISVDRNGQVVKAEHDAARSQNVDACMLEHAMASAKRARFNALVTSSDPQKGTLYFLFMPQ
ncbi:MAG TPA: hypothetical protein PKJ19_04135 [Flavobacteriales bacterium]|nr:hypothetical protein [Flavobacteriales bacterium]HNU55588.1 hypothetical protein [Flavobacteriales bacterium]